VQRILDAEFINYQKTSVCADEATSWTKPRIILLSTVVFQSDFGCQVYELSRAGLVGADLQKFAPRSRARMIVWLNGSRCAVIARKKVLAAVYFQEFYTQDYPSRVHSWQCPVRSDAFDLFGAYTDAK